MYNRYIGNTGKYYRVDDDRHSDTRVNMQMPITSTDSLDSPCSIPVNNTISRQSRTHSVLPNNPVGSIRKLVGNFLPKGTEIGDLLLILVLLLLYLEKEDEEILIILSVLIFNGFM